MLLRAVALLALTGCACEGPEGPVDAGRDASVDAAADAGDAGQDAGRDAGRDAGYDGGPTDPGWVRMPGLPEECWVERATHPEVLYEPRWEPCPEQPVGCLRERPHGLDRQDIVGVDGWFDGARGYAWILIDNATVLVQTDGPALGAWRERPNVGGDDMSCLLFAGVGGGHAALSVSYRNLRAIDRSADFVYHAPVSEIGAAVEPLAVESNRFGGSVPQFLAVSAELVVAEVQTAAVVYAWNTDGRSGPLYADEVSGNPQTIHAVGEYAIWNDFGSLPRIAFASFDRPASFLYRNDPSRIRAIHTDGTWLGWVDAYDTLELYVAPLVFDPDALEPRHVGPAPSTQFTGMGGGWWSTLLDATHIQFVELATGRTKTWTAPPDFTLNSERAPEYLAAEEILLRVASRSLRTGLFVRLDPRTLPYDDE